MNKYIHKKMSSILIFIIIVVVVISFKLFTEGIIKMLEV
jgi:hypothetical protein